MELYFSVGHSLAAPVTRTPNALYQGFFRMGSTLLIAELVRRNRDDSSHCWDKILCRGIKTIKVATIPLYSPADSLNYDDLDRAKFRATRTRNLCQWARNLTRGKKTGRFSGSGKKGENE